MLKSAEIFWQVAPLTNLSENSNWHYTITPAEMDHCMNQLPWRSLLQSMRQVYSKCSLVRFQEMTLGSALTTRNCKNKEL